MWLSALTPNFFWGCRNNKNKHLFVLTAEDNTIYKALLSWFRFLISYLVILPVLLLENKTAMRLLKRTNKSTLHICLQALSRWLVIEIVEPKPIVFPYFWKKRYCASTQFILLDFPFNSSFHWVSSIWCGGSRALCCHNGLTDRREWGFWTPPSTGRVP